MAPESAKPMLKVLSEGAAILSSLFPSQSCQPLRRVPVIRFTPCDRIIAGFDSGVHTPVRKAQQRLSLRDPALRDPGGFRSRIRAGDVPEFTRQRAELDDRQLLGPRRWGYSGCG